MPTPQTSYSRSFSAGGLNGTRYDDDGAFRAEAYVNAEASALAAGIGVTRGATAGTAEEPDSALDPIVGISINSFARDPDDLTGNQAIKASATFDACSEGAMWVLPEQTVAVGDPVYVRHTSDGGSNTQLGKFRKDADSGRARLVKGARWLKGGSTTECAALYFSAAAELSQDGEQVVVADHAQATADTTLKIFKNRSDRYFLVEKVRYVNPTGLAQDAANFFNLKIQHGAGPTVAANWSTETGQQGTIAADTFVDFVNAAEANRLLAPDAELSLMLDESGTATLPAGKVVVHGRYV